MGAVFGPLHSSKRYFLHNLNLVNTVRGLVERVFVVKGEDGSFVSPPPPKSKGHFATTLLPELRILTGYSLLRPLSTADTVPLWKGLKQAVYRRAFLSLEVKKLSREDGCLRAFVKCEKIDASKVDPAPRVIQPREARYNLHLARFLKPHESAFYSRIDKMFDTDGLGDKTIFKGMNASKTAEELLLKSSRYSSPVYIGLDASRFDQHVSEDALRWEHSIYMSSFAYGLNELEMLLEWQIHNKGRSYLPDGRIEYSVLGRRMSGDMNTSLGNCLLMSSMVHAYCRHKRIPQFSLANNGDDCVLIFEKKYLHLTNDLASWFLDIGFNMKREEPVYDIRQVSFCQVNVLTSPGYNICVRNPEVVASKDLHSAYRFSQPDEYLQWLFASGTCGRMSSAGVPVLEAFYNAFPEGTPTNLNIRRELDTWLTYSIAGGSKCVPISPEIRHSLWIAFNILPDCQIALEDIYKRTRFGDTVGNVTAIPYLSIFQGNIDNITQLSK